MGGISGLLGGVSLLGLLLFILGIVLVVASASQGRPVRGGVVLAIVGLIAWGLLSITSSGILIVEPTQVAVVTNTLNGTLEEPERGSGTTVIIPMVQQATLYDIRQREYTMAAVSTEGSRPDDDAVAATTIDGQQVQVDVTLIYSLNRDQANDVHLRWGKNERGEDAFVENFIRPTARTVVRDVIATLRAENIYGAQRAEMQTRIEDAMRSEMEKEGLVLSSFLVRGLKFSDDFTTAIENKEIAQQKVQQAEQDAERARTEAQGRRDAAILEAEGERDAAIARAQGQAEALSLVSEQLVENPSLIQYLYVQNLSDNVRLILVPSNSPFLFDLNSVAGSGTTVIPDLPNDTDTTP